MFFLCIVGALRCVCVSAMFENVSYIRTGPTVARTSSSALQALVLGRLYEFSELRLVCIDAQVVAF